MPHPKKGYLDENGNPLPGVTTILRQVDVQGLIGAANKMGLRGREVYGPRGEWSRAADIGTCAHARIEAFIRGEHFSSEHAKSPELFMESEKAFQSFLRWAEGREFTGQSEVGLVHPRGFGGTVDYIDTDECALYDWKTSKSLGASAVAQVCGGYGMLCEESTTLFIPRMFHIVRFPKEGGEAEQWTIPATSPTAKAGRLMFESLLASYKATAEIEGVNAMRMKFTSAAKE